MPKLNEDDIQNALTRPIEVIVQIGDSDVILLDIHPSTQSDYVGFGSHFNDIAFRGSFRIPREPYGFIVNWKSVQQLYLFSGS